MPLWFVFLNAAIATDLLLSQLMRLNVARLQAIHRWYLPVASLTAFTLALPLLIYHSAYQPTANVFSVQFPSVLSVTLYYILAFDLWIAIGILYCFVVVSLVVGVIVIKLRQKRAAWDRQNRDQQVESGWVSRPAAEIKNEECDQAEHSDDADQHVPVTAVASETETTPVLTSNGNDDGEEGSGKLHTGRHSCDTTTTTNSSINSVQYSESYRLQTFFAREIPNSSRSGQPPAPVIDTSNGAGDPGDTLVSGITFDNSKGTSLPESSTRHGAMLHPKSVLFAVPFNHGDSSCGSSFSSSGSGLSEISAIDVAQLSVNAAMEPANPRHETFTSGATAINSPEITPAVGPPQSTSSTANDSTHGDDNAGIMVDKKSEPSVRTQKPLITLQSLPPQFTLRSSNQSTLASQSHSTPFRIPTLALVRLLLYPLIPIFSFTLMCVVRWVWFRSTMPSRWEILNVVSGFLRAMEGLLCLVVFLLNPALNRSFREIRKRNTPVFT
ncbi:hypothetical protein GGI20_000747 [Coemansia sp. BCRC 34301]|nr:hypothetical protein GGI20_000747 [Coemansia sp. BCRC 34301]